MSHLPLKLLGLLYFRQRWIVSLMRKLLGFFSFFLSLSLPGRLAVGKGDCGEAETRIVVVPEAVIGEGKKECIVVERR